MAYSLLSHRECCQLFVGIKLPERSVTTSHVTNLLKLSEGIITHCIIYMFTFNKYVLVLGFSHLSWVKALPAFH